MPDEVSTLDALSNVLAAAAIVLSLVAGLIVSAPVPDNGHRLDRSGRPVQPVQIVAGIRG